MPDATDPIDRRYARVEGIHARQLLQRAVLPLAALATNGAGPLDVDWLPRPVLALRLYRDCLQATVVDVDIEGPGASSVHANLDAQPGLRAQRQLPHQGHAAHFVARVGGEDVAIEIRVASNATHPAAGAAETGAQQRPVGVPVLHQVGRTEQLGR